MDSVIKLKNIVEENIQTIAPKLNFFYSTKKIIQLLKEGETIADSLLKDRQLLEDEFKQEIEKQKAEQQKELDRIKNDAYNSGLDKAREEVYGQFTEMLTFIEKSQKSINQELAKIYNSTEQQIVELSLRIAQKLVQHELSVNAELLNKLIRNVLSDINEQNHLDIQVHPDDYQMLSKNLDLIKKEAGAIKDFKVTQNAAINRGGAIFIMDSGRIDSQIESQIDRMKASFFNG